MATREMIRRNGNSAGKSLAPGFYRTPAGRRVEVVGTIVGDQVVYIDGQRRRTISGPLARQHFKLELPKRRDALRQPTPPPAEDPRGSMTVVVYVLGLLVVALLGIGLWVANHLPKVEW